MCQFIVRMAFGRLPDVYECLTRPDQGPGGVATISIPGLGDPSFVNCYENTYGRLYRRLLRSKGFSCDLEFPSSRSDEVLATLLDLHRTLKAYWFSKTEKSILNPLLVGCDPVRVLIDNWLHESDQCALASNGLMYPDMQAISDFGPGRMPSGRAARTALIAMGVTDQRSKGEASRQKSRGFFRSLWDFCTGTTIVPGFRDEEMFDPGDFITAAPPRYLFRGQGTERQPLSPFVRRLVDSSPDEDRRRAKTDFYIDHQLFKFTGGSLLMTVSQALAVTHTLCHNFPDRTGNTLFPTPFNLLWYYGPWDVEEVYRLCGSVVDVSIYLCTAEWGSREELAIFFSHLTDYAYPVPVHVPVQFVTDFVPNPFVSTTTDITRALLYASGYFEKFSDKFDVDWDKVDWKINHPEGGYVYLIHIPSEGPDSRKVVPISEMASFLPRPYRTVGMLESEVGVTGRIHAREVVMVREAQSVLSRLKQNGLWTKLVVDPQSVEPEKIVKRVFN